MEYADYPFLTIEAPATFAAEAGFEGERAVDTWRRRMRMLRDLGFIEAKKGPTGDFHYVLLLNPNVGIEKLSRVGKVQTVLYGRFRDRLIDIGAQNDITDYDDYFEALEKTEAKAVAKNVKRTVVSSDTPAKTAKSTSVSAKPKSRGRSKLKVD